MTPKRKQQFLKYISKKENPSKKELILKLKLIETKK